MNRPADSPDSFPLSTVEALIRSVGARVTPARVRVLCALRGSPGLRSHGEIEAALDQEGLPAMDRVTLYRVLDWLTEAGLAHRTVDGRGVFRFSGTAVAHADHVHFRCTGCRNVFCLDMAPPPAPSLPAGFQLSGIDVDVHGECPACAHKEP